MIIIKDKDKNTQMMIPRNGNLSDINNVADYVTIQHFNSEVKDLETKIENDINNSIEQVTDEVNEMINSILGGINNELENILA